jgi:hypothetical protein
MSGFDNEVMYAPGERLTSSSTQDISLMQKTGTDVSRVNHVGDPNLAVAANPSSLSHDPTTGFLWLKVSGTGITTWQRLFPSPTPPILSVQTANATPQFNLVGTTSKVDFGLTNLLLGSPGSSITSAVGSVGLGLQALSAISSGFNNTAVGFQSAFLITSGHANTALGYQSLGTAAATTNGNIAIGQSAGAALLGDNNTVVGTNALSNGGVNNNIAIGSTSANTYVGPESNNIMIGNVGVVGESHVMRLGTSGSLTGQVNTTFVAAITGVTAVGSPVAVSSTGQLSDLGFGTAGQVLTSTGAASSPVWAGGASVLTITSVNHAASPYTVLAADEFLAVQSSGGAITIKLPNAPTTGRVIYIKDSNGAANANPISVTTVGGTVTIDGSTTYTINTNYGSISVLFDGSNYEVF